MMSIQGQTLEVRVAGCNKLKDTKWVSRQKPYVSIEYGGSKFLSSICTDGGPNPTFQEKNTIILIEGIRVLKVSVWCSNTMTYDHLIGSASVQLQKVLSEGFDETTCAILSKSNRYAGEVCLVMNVNKPIPGFASPQFCASPIPQCCASPAPQCCAVLPLPPQQVPLYYAPPPVAAPPQPSMYPQVYAPQAYPQQPYPPQGYPPNYPPQY